MKPTIAKGKGTASMDDREGTGARCASTDARLETSWVLE